MNKSYGLVVGVAAIIIWSFSAIIISSMKVPPFESLAMALFISLTLLVIKISWQKNWKNQKIPINTCVFLGLNQICYYLSFQFASPVLIDIIIWLWPIMFIILLQLKQKQTLQKKIYLAIALGLIASLLNSPFNINFKLSYYIGICLAVIANLAWCGYMLNTNKDTMTADNTILGLTSSLPIVIALHYYFEPLIIPSSNDLLRIALLGIFPLNLAFIAWSYACKYSCQIRLSILSYITPTASIIWIICFSNQQFSLSIALSILCLSAAHIIANR